MTCKKVSKAKAAQNTKTTEEASPAEDSLTQTKDLNGNEGWIQVAKRKTAKLHLNKDLSIIENLEKHTNPLVVSSLSQGKKEIPYTAAVNKEVLQIRNSKGLAYKGDHRIISNEGNTRNKTKGPASRQVLFKRKPIRTILRRESNTDGINSQPEPIIGETTCDQGDSQMQIPTTGEDQNRDKDNEDGEIEQQGNQISQGTNQNNTTCLNGNQDRSGGTESTESTETGSLIVRQEIQITEGRNDQDTMLEC